VRTKQKNEKNFIKNRGLNKKIYILYSNTYRNASFFDSFQSDFFRQFPENCFARDFNRACITAGCKQKGEKKWKK